MHEPNRQPDLLERQAAEWVVRLQRTDVPPAERERLARWLAQSPRHADAYDRARRAWQLSGALRDDPLFADPVPPAPALRRYQPLWLAACLLLAVTLGWQAGHQWWSPLHSDFRTAAGEIRTVELADGSDILLGGDTAIRLAYTDDERRVELLRGEAIFRPSPRAGSETRAFVVEAAGTRSEALGTRYLVRQLDDRHGWAGVLEHSIQVSHGDGPALTLTAGESARFSTDTIARSPLDPQQEAAWSRGMLMFRQQPLTEVIDRLRQYGAPRTLILNPALAGTPVTAVFRLDNIRQALPTLRQELALRTLQLPGALVIY